MSHSRFLLLALLFLPGCETLNDAVVRHMLKEPGLSGEVRDQIRKGLEKREQAPPAVRPQEPPPPFMDQG